MSMIELTPTETTMYNDLVINNRLLTDQYIVLGPHTGTNTWTENIRLSSNGAINTISDITCGGT